MYNINNVGGKPLENRTKVEFPLALAVDNVELFNVAPNDKIQGLSFSFKRVEDNVVLEPGQPAVNTISFLTDTILHPNKDYCKGGRVMQDGTVQTLEEEYDSRVKQFMGYVRSIASTAGVTKEEFDTIGEVASYDDFAEQFCRVVNASKKGVKCYLRTVKDKNGYTKLPLFRGKGMIAPMSDGYPEIWVYSDYERNMIEAAGITGVQTTEPKKAVSFDDI